MCGKIRTEGGRRGREGRGRRGRREKKDFFKGNRGRRGRVRRWDERGGAGAARRQRRTETTHGDMATATGDPEGNRNAGIRTQARSKSRRKKARGKKEKKKWAGGRRQAIENHQAQRSQHDEMPRDGRVAQHRTVRDAPAADDGARQTADDGSTMDRRWQMADPMREITDGR